MPWLLPKPKYAILYTFELHFKVHKRSRSDHMLEIAPLSLLVTPAKAFIQSNSIDLTLNLSVGSITLYGDSKDLQRISKIGFNFPEGSIFLRVKKSRG
jgi:hypothetical protein